LLLGEQHPSPFLGNSRSPYELLTGVVKNGYRVKSVILKSGRKTVAFVGGGPTAIYTLHALISEAKQPFALTIFEEQAGLGRGTPYRPGWNDPAMLSNIASIEIPPIEQTLVDWLLAQPASVLDALGVEREKIGERTFYPRLVLGEYFYSQCDALLTRAREKGIAIIVRTRCRVTDAVSEVGGMTLTVRPRKGETFNERFDHVVMATGHQWPASPEVRPGYFLCPWPASALADIPPCEVGIRGTSLTAIDATVALAVSHGEFADGSDGRLQYVPAAGTEAFHMTMMSRKGLLPEADFYVPLPYEPLAICTPQAIEDLIEGAETDLLDQVFDLFKQELCVADPAYAEKMGLPGTGLEEFHERYFSDRAGAEPFQWAEQNLKEAQRNYESQTIVAWRYAILRMHEVIERLVPYFEGLDYERFSRFFKPIFVDDYATVPHKSINRMLALHRAGKLDVMAIGDKYRIDTYRPEGGVELQWDGQNRSFAVFIEAMGQKPLPAKEFPFPSLLRQGIIHDVAASSGGRASRGIAIDDQFHPISDDIPDDQLFCLSLPFILGRHPFHQGITSSHEMGVLVGERLASVIGDKVAAPAEAMLQAVT
jgi:uncharacterized NAD(P)/FAD-binding protein YdhS